MSQFDISVSKAKQDKLFYVVANVIIVDYTQQKFLLLKRSERETVLPGKWSYPGGKLEHTEVAELITDLGKPAIDGIDNIIGKLAAREAKEECGLKVQEDGKIIRNKVFVRPDGIPVFMATIASEYSGGEVILEHDAFTDHAWVSLEESKNYDCIDGIQEEAALALHSQ